jgi:hypothetical protein
MRKLISKETLRKYYVGEEDFDEFWFSPCFYTNWVEGGCLLLATRAEDYTEEFWRIFDYLFDDAFLEILGGQRYYLAEFVYFYEKKELNEYGEVGDTYGVLDSELKLIDEDTPYFSLQRDFYNCVKNNIPPLEDWAEFDEEQGRYTQELYEHPDYEYLEEPELYVLRTEEEDYVLETWDGLIDFVERMGRKDFADQEVL